ncbi:MAG: 6,7-dimethyl-8-ribityllumazine synthase [Candidatus Hodgkinia cicadicola]
MLFLIKDLRVLILVSCYHVYLTDLVLKRLIAKLNTLGFVFYTTWFFGAYELGWLLKFVAPRYCACIVLGFVLKGISIHNALVSASVYNNALRYPIVNCICSLDYVELAWNRALSLNVGALATSLKTVIGISSGMLCC